MPSFPLPGVALRRLFLAALFVPTVAFAQNSPATRPAPPSTAPTTSPATQSLTVGDKTVSYNAKADFITLRDDEGKPQAKFFHITYAVPVTDPATRPITFVFNGGPGSSSVWLHLGAVGPKKVVLGDDALPPPPPGRLVDNPDSWLPATDLVFIDPIGTGYSRAEPGVDAKKYYSVDGDIASVAEFIRIYLGKNNRWSSPKFLAGESYGTTRAAGLSNYLSQNMGIDLSGILLVSSVLDFSTIRDVDGNDLPDILFLPSYSATAHHHKKLPPALQSQPWDAVRAQVEAFALGDYSRALASGVALPAEQRDAVAQKLAEFSGLPKDYITRANLRISPFRFMKTLLADQQKIVGRFDATLTAFDTDPASGSPDFDPSYTAYHGTYTSAFNTYVRQGLKFESDDKYNILAGLPWTYPQGRFVDTASNLADAITQNPHLRVFVASGYQDLATPYFATEYTLNRLPLPPEARKNLTVKHYLGGHMMYHYPQSLKQLGDDARAFLTR